MDGFKVDEADNWTYIQPSWVLTTRSGVVQPWVPVRGMLPMRSEWDWPRWTATVNSSVPAGAKPVRPRARTATAG
ncbi:MAG: hypothetical protein WBN99_12220 [Mycobacterium sp.]